MPIQVGDRIPEAKFRVMTENGPAWATTDDVFKGKTVVLFAVPGAFTPTCHNNHLPGFLARADEIKAKGVDTIAVTAVNDVFVMHAWRKAAGADGRIEFLADGNGDFAKAIGMTMDVSAGGLGLRSKRYAMLVKDGEVARISVEPEPGQAVATSAESVLATL
ncbi:Peroxiredoxin [Rhodovulum sp. PH10]|uniref:peroxiredoxin n=1 Tax=Rhodovulum sp. PH10 TaxID=1187851 RepID=UPI00027C1FC5|nr:peroxiredoxin [Rhodovulum sp. PH10]EJW12937.1 Peroxiredoxin [Rhodovulum sp. PH10]